MIQAGMLRHRITIQTPVSTVDATGRRNSALVRGATIPANVEAITAAEGPYADGVAQRTAYSIRVRYPSAIAHGLTVATVLEYRDQQLQVTATRREREEEDVMIVEAAEVR
jgi:SPP1 family predicted phage head-tail adaptor